MTDDDSAEALIRAPSLRTDGDRTASRLELFYDLAFVLVVAQVAVTLSDDLSWHGAGVFLGLVVVVWWAWASTTLYANRYDTDDLVFRGLVLLGMLAVVGMAASAAGAVGGEGGRFAACYVALRITLIVQYVRAHVAEPAARASTRIYLWGHSLGAVLWAASIPAHGSTRYLLWAIGLAVELAAPLLAGRWAADVPVHLDHLPERFGLFIILVMGESVAAVAAGVREMQWRSGAVASAVLAFVVAAALWWSYFDLAGAAAKRALIDTEEDVAEDTGEDADADTGEDAGADSRGERGSAVTYGGFLFAHLPVSAGLIAVGVGLEHAIMEAGEREPRLSTATLFSLVLGVAGYVVGACILSALTRPVGPLRSRLGWSVAALPGLAAALAVSQFLRPVALLGLLVVLLVAVVGAGSWQQRRGRLVTSEL